MEKEELTPNPEGSKRAVIVSRNKNQLKWEECEQKFNDALAALTMKGENPYNEVRLAELAGLNRETIRKHLKAKQEQDLDLATSPVVKVAAEKSAISIAKSTMEGNERSQKMVLEMAGQLKKPKSGSNNKTVNVQSNTVVNGIFVTPEMFARLSPETRNEIESQLNGAYNVRPLKKT